MQLPQKPLTVFVLKSPLKTNRRKSPGVGYPWLRLPFSFISRLARSTARVVTSSWPSTPEWPHPRIPLLGNGAFISSEPPHDINPLLLPKWAVLEVLLKLNWKWHSLVHECYIHSCVVVVFLGGYEECYTIIYDYFKILFQIGII